MKIDHDRFMRRAIELAQNAPDNPFGSLLVNKESGEIVAEGWNQTKEKRDPTSHGEMEAINDYVNRHRYEETNWRDLILYTTAEPCAMCSGAIYWAGISMVVFGSSIPFLLSLGQKWYAIDIRAAEVMERARPKWEGEVIGGILEKECDELFQRAPLV